MKEENKITNKEQGSLVVPLVIFVLFIFSAYATYTRVYKQDNIYYFTSEEEVQNFNPIGVIYGNN